MLAHIKIEGSPYGLEAYMLLYIRDGESFENSESAIVMWIRTVGRKEDKIIRHDRRTGWSSASCRVPIHDHFLPTPFFSTPQISFFAHHVEREYGPVEQVRLTITRQVSLFRQNTLWLFWKIKRGSKVYILDYPQNCPPQKCPLEGNSDEWPGRAILSRSFIRIARPNYFVFLGGCGLQLVPNVV